MQQNQKVSRFPRMEPKGDREVIVVTTVTLTTRTPVTRFQYQGMTEQQILDYEQNQETDTLLEDFVDDVVGTPAEDLIIVRAVNIEDKK